MADTTLREKIVVDGTEQAAAKLNTMAAAAGRVANAFSGLRAAAGMVGGVAGLWQIAEGVRDVDRLYQAVLRVTDMTGMAADHAHAMFDMFELSGVEMEAAERIITSMTRSAAKLSDGMGGIGMQAQMVNGLMQRLGVSIKAGPEDRLLAMSKAAQAGKLDVNQLIQAFMIPRSQASAMMSMLRQGPERLRQIQKDTLTGADVIDDKTLETYRTMLQARRELKDAWGDLIGVFYKSLIPGVTAILQGIKKLFDDVAPIAAAIGKGLASHMELVIKLTKTYLALLLASKAINLFSGPENQLGIFGRGRQILGGAARFLDRGRVAGGAMDYFEARAASPALGMFEKAGAGPLATILTSLRGLPALFGGLASSAGALIPSFVALLPVIGVIAAAIAAVAIIFYAIKNNMLGIRDQLKRTFGAIMDAFRAAWEALKPVLLLLWEALKPLVYVVGVVLVTQLMMFAKMIEFTAHVIKFFIENNPLLRGAAWLAAKAGLTQAQQAEEAKATPNKAGAGTYQDFRGSKFEITNNFPTGIDGGRVAVAFGDDLARLGERRLDSGLRPLFSYR